MSDLTSDVLAQWKAKMSGQKNPAGIVVRPAVEMHLRAALQTSQNGLSFALDIFTDNDQTDDCLVFYDRNLLRAYLNRKDDPVGYAKALLAARKGE